MVIVNHYVHASIACRCGLAQNNGVMPHVFCARSIDLSMSLPVLPSV